MGTEKMLVIRKKLDRQAHEMGAQFFGVADLTSAGDFIARQGGAFLERYPRALSMAVTLHDGIVDELPQHNEIPVAKTYDYLYHTVNATLNRIGLRLSIILNDHGFETLLVPASDTLDKEACTGLFSHKLAARLAGLGWIGPSCLLITPEVGPRARWITVLTDAPLEAGEPLPNGCGDCRQCVDICPAKAFTGRPFDSNEPREARFKVRRCVDYRVHLEEKVSGTRVCGMCLYVCPFGRKDLTVE